MPGETPAITGKSAVDCFTFGSLLPGRNYSSGSYRFGFNGQEKDDEVYGATGTSYTAEFWQYDTRTAQRWNIDPVIKPWESPYATFRRNPIWFTDINGDDPSTHTDEDGNVLAVYNDGDNSVYAHKNGTTKGDIDMKRAGTCDPSCPTDPSTSGGGTKMGETANWDEFVNPETGQTMTSTKIQFGKSFDGIIAQMHEKAEGMDLREIAANSHGGGLFDIKKDYVGVGALLDGKYATSRSAGNYLAGLNAEGGTYFGASISFDTFQKLAGALHVMESQGNQLTDSQKAGIILNGTAYGPAPAYGEVMYQYRMSKAGWDAAKLKNR